MVLLPDSRLEFPVPNRFRDAHCFLEYFLPRVCMLDAFVCYGLGSRYLAAR